nr:50S ribosomal protein L21, chloroplastic [Tanacetum cinerariifolium]
MAMSLCYCPSSITSILTNNNKTTLISPAFNFNFPVSSIRQTSSLSLSSSSYSSIVAPKVSQIETASVEKEEEGEAVEFEAADASENGEEAKGEEVFAVVMIGGRQYIVFPGRFLYTQRLKGAAVDDKIILNKVLLVGTKTSTYIGKPVVPNAAVHAVVEEQGLDPKVVVFKYKKKKNYRRNIGHRQPNTRIRILEELEDSLRSMKVGLGTPAVLLCRGFYLINGFKFGWISFRSFRNGDITFCDRVFPEKLGEYVKNIDLLSLIKEEVRFTSLFDSDSIRVCLLLSLEVIFMGHDLGSAVDDVFLRIVEDLEDWNDFPGGRTYIWILKSSSVTDRWWSKDSEGIPRGCFWSKHFPFQKCEYFGQLFPQSDQDGEPFFKYMGSTNPSANKDAVNDLVDALDDLVDENGVVEVDKYLSQDDFLKAQKLEAEKEGGRAEDTKVVIDVGRSQYQE